MLKLLKNFSSPAILVLCFILFAIPEIARAAVNFAGNSWALDNSMSMGDNVAGLLTFTTPTPTGSSFDLNFNNTSPSGGYTGTITITGTGTTVDYSDQITGVYHFNSLVLSQGSLNITISATGGSQNMFTYASVSDGNTVPPFGKLNTANFYGSQMGSMGNATTITVTFSFSGALFSSTPSTPINVNLNDPNH